MSTEILNKVKGAIYAVPIMYADSRATFTYCTIVEIIQIHRQTTGVPTAEYYYRNTYVGIDSVWRGQVFTFASPESALEHLLAQKGVQLAV